MNNQNEIIEGVIIEDGKMENEYKKHVKIIL